MKHLIISNKFAGNDHQKEGFEKLINNSFVGTDYELYYTTGPREVIPYLHKYLKEHSNDLVRVYACGGDGTVNEVANGLIGEQNAELAVFPIGTGNDFVKAFAPKKDYDDIVTNKTGETLFLNFPKLINGKTKSIDATRISGPSLKEDWYSVNVVNFGFDAIVGAMGNWYKEHGIPSDAKEKEKNDPYTYALNHDAMKHGRFNDTVVYADGEQLNEKQILLGTVAQGQFVGGSFWCAPKSDNTDGLLDVCVLKTMNLLALGLKYIKPYTKGKHLSSSKFKKVVYRRAKEVKICAPNEIDVCIDGEMVKGNEFTLKCVPAALKIVVPEE